MDRTQVLVLLVCGAALVACAWGLSSRRRPQLFGSEAIRVRLRFAHWLVIFGAVVTALGMVGFKSWFSVLNQQSAVNPLDSNFLSLATVLVLFMLFGFVAFEAGTVSSAYRNQSAEKNLLVIMFSLGAYLLIGHLVRDSVGHFVHVVLAGKPTDATGAIVFQAGFACTVSLIVSNALTERASRLTNVLCAIFCAGLGYPVLAGLVWGDGGLLRLIGFADASGASSVHLLGAAASLTAAAAVGSRVRLQRWRFLGSPETPDFSSPWSVVGGLFLYFGWLGFNSGNAPDELHGHAFYNTTVGACSGVLAAWVLSRLVGRWSRASHAKSEQTSLQDETAAEQATLLASVEGLKDRPRIVIGMMGGLVAVTANGALPQVGAWMAFAESLVGGAVAVVVSTWMSARSRSRQIDDPLGVIGTHGCAAIVGILATAFWLTRHDAESWAQISWMQLITHLAAQLVGCGACIVVGWLAAMVPCWFILAIERRSLGKGTWTAASVRLRLGAIEQLGTPLETPLDIKWKYRIEEAARQIKEPLQITNDVDGDAKWLEAVETYAAAAEVLDKSSQAEIAHRIVEALPKTADRSDGERVSLVALGSSAEYKPKDIKDALTECLKRAGRNGYGLLGIELPNGEKPNGEKPSRDEMLVWSIALLTERAAILHEAGLPDVREHAEMGLNFLQKVTKWKDSKVTNAKNNHAKMGLNFLQKVTKWKDSKVTNGKNNATYDLAMVQEHARVGIIDSNARLLNGHNGKTLQKHNGSVDHYSQLLTAYGPGEQPHSELLEGVDEEFLSAIESQISEALNRIEATRSDLHESFRRTKQLQKETDELLASVDSE